MASTTSSHSPQLHKHYSTLLPDPSLPYAAARAANPPPMISPPPQATARHTSESSPHGQGTPVPTCVRFEDENMICPSPRPVHEQRKGWYKFCGCVFVISPLFPFSLFHGDDSTDPQPSLSLLAGTDSGQTREVQTRGTGTGVPPGPRQLGCVDSDESQDESKTNAS